MNFVPKTPFPGLGCMGIFIGKRFTFDYELSSTGMVSAISYKVPLLVSGKKTN